MQLSCRANESLPHANRASPGMGTSQLGPLPPHKAYKKGLSKENYSFRSGLLERLTLNFTEQLQYTDLLNITMYSTTVDIKIQHSLCRSSNDAPKTHSCH
ncbi:hypothetical protein GDO78_005985 [Eleutherodactylus coqui]|uniref:Uncharacterized protein n=1 Tax=Eleutherodactylus coqui TaxID=57060 RepID=A0A8J6FPH9_ELECQ|nr:hypothetical protein GDO78_005985 [Eleutherodactylus coqui]